jgi:hypothetical protein
MARILPLFGPIPVGSGLARPQAGSWGGAAAIPLGGPVDYGDGSAAPPPGQLARLATHGATALGGAVVIGSDGATRIGAPTRILTDEQCDLIWRRTPDVRAGFDQIARVISTADWTIKPSGLAPQDKGYDEALVISEEVRQFILRPTMDDFTWQEVASMWILDLLKYDKAPMELVSGPRTGALTELIPVNGAEIEEETDKFGRLVGYIQNPLATAALNAGDVGSQIRIPPARMFMLQLSRSTSGPGGVPLLESLVYEVISVLRGAEFIAQGLDLNEIPPGILVLTGIARDAKERFDAKMEAEKNKPWRTRTITGTPGQPVDAKWVELRRAPRDLQVAELMKEVRRAIWRVIGMMPVTMGDTERTPRATAEVQLDASQSHLINPILELVEAKLNARVLPLLVPPEYQGIVAFRFIRERDLTEGEKDQRAQRLARLVAAGIKTRNEARAELGDDPVPGGDILTVGEGATVKPLGEVIGLTSSTQAQQIEEFSRRSSRARSARLKAAQAALRDGPTRALVQRASRRLALRGASDLLPSDWQPEGKFRGRRTMDLGALWEEVSGYTRDVLPLWEEAREAAISIVAAHYKEEGFDASARSEVVRDLANELDALVTRWAIAVAPRYERVALAARNRAGEWVATVPSEEQVRRQADGYRTSAMAYLTDADGLVTDLRTRLIGILVAVTDSREAGVEIDYRAARAEGLSPGETAAAVLGAIGRAFDTAQHRIKNWAGKLVDLAYQVLNSAVADAHEVVVTEDGTQSVQAIDWWVEWADSGGPNECVTCEYWGAQGYVRLSTLPVVPGGGTECRGNCRCVLVYWTKAEIDGGSADDLGSGNTGRPL